MKHSPSYLERLALLTIIVLYLVMGSLYALRTPAWQTPDEPAHFNYIRYLAQQGQFPVLQPGDYDEAYLQRLKSSRFDPALSVDSVRYEFHQPPLYYLLAAPVYLLTRSLGVIPSLLALRLLSLGLGALLLWVVYGVLTRTFHDPLLRLAPVGLMATVPMHVAMTAAVNNDTLAELVLALIVWLAVRRAQGGVPDRQWTLWGGLLYALALLAKTTIYAPGAAVLAAAELLYLYRFAPHAPGISRLWHASIQALRTLIPLALVALLLSGAWFVRNGLTYGPTDLFGLGRHDAVVLGQPTTAAWLAREEPARVAAEFVTTTLHSFWAQFGWMGVLVSDRLYLLYYLLSGVGAAGALLYLRRIARVPGASLANERAAVILLSVTLALAAAAYIGYNFRYQQPQGRYLFPALPAICVWLMLGWREVLAPEYRRLFFALSYVVMLALDYVCLAWFIVPQLSGS